MGVVVLILRLLVRTEQKKAADLNILSSAAPNWFERCRASKSGLSHLTELDTTFEQLKFIIGITK